MIINSWNLTSDHTLEQLEHDHTLEQLEPDLTLSFHQVHDNDCIDADFQMKQLGAFHVR